ncbi:MAG: protein translocase subunit SecD [Dehalococcoidia bacterium]|nr:MAG: protein translocase subunit SecD [Dehalococcoidia bacterium]
MRRWWNRLFVVLVFVIAGASIYAVWPDQPDRYLPSAIPWPSGRGIPGKLGPLKLPCHSTGDTTNPAADCRGMTLGLDLQGGSRIVLQADVAGINVSPEDLNSGLDAAKQIVENRINPFGVSESQVQRSGTDKLVVELPGVSQQTAKDITRPAVLMFCEALQQGGQGASTGTSTAVAVVPPGTQVYYKPGTCEPDVDANGEVATGTGSGQDRQPVKDANGNIVRVKPQYVSASALNSQVFESVVWTPAKGDLNGVPTIMTGSYLKSNAQVQFTQLGAPVLNFNMTNDGQQIFGSLSQRLTGMPLATFLDGDPIRGEQGQILAPTIQSTITDSGQTTGLSLGDAKRLRTFLNNGAFPIPLKVIQQQDVDATLGDKAVLHSVQAGLVAMLLIMAFMILYYRLPGVIASLALVVYTAVVLAIFKIGIPGSGPVTLTLAGIAAFVLSVGMAVDANILIFERSKEELRNGRSLIPAVEAGFSRAWSSIRDSNISTLITCAILYWMGNRFGSSLIKGFSLTLAIGVIISLFSAITVTRTFLRLAMSTPLARPLWLWTDDTPDAETPMSTQGVPGMEGAENA